MTRILTAADRSALIRLASALPAGDETRRAILAGLQGFDPKTEAEWQEFLDMQERYAPPPVYHQYVRDYWAWQRKQKAKGSKSASMTPDDLMRVEAEIDEIFDGGG